jgi:subtilisin family serine protease
MSQELTNANYLLGETKMKRLIMVSVIVLFACGLSMEAEARNLRAVGEAAVKNKEISDPPREHDFTKIAPDASYRAGEVLVRFAPKANGAERSKVEKNAVLASIGGGNIKRSFGLVPGLAHVIVPKDLTVEQALRRFNGRSEILYAEPDYEVQIVATPNDTNFSDLWGMHNTGQTGGTADADIDANEAWDISTDANEIVVAVIDTGINYTHPDLADNMWVNQTELSGTPGVDDDNNGYVDDIYGYDFCTYGQSRDSDPNDDHYHGTHCAGTIGAVGDNNEGVVGVCWKVKIMALKFMGPTGTGGADGYVSDAIDAIEYSVAMDANLSSNSWGGGCYSQSLKNAIESAGAAGLLFVAAAGNSYDDSDNYPLYPAAYDCNSIVSVMATSDDDGFPSFSNYGLTSVDLGAPGTEILSTFPTYMTSSMSTRGYSTDYETISGTSMATPHVAGACALLWSENLTLSNSQIKERILRTVDRTLPGWCVSEGRLNVHSALLNTSVHNVTQRISYNTIQGALDEANDLDLIRVHPGTYYETIDFKGVNCTLTSTDPNDPNVVAATIIDANGGLIAVYFHNSEDANSVLTGVTVTNANQGVKADSASPTITKCVIEDNDSYGVLCTWGSPTISNCTIRTHHIMGIYCRISSATIESCLIEDSGWNGVAAYGSSSAPSIRYNEIRQNDYDGIYLLSLSASVKSNWIYDNSRYGIRTSNSGSAVLRNNTIVGNSAAGIYNAGGTQATISNCIIWDCNDDLYNCTAEYSCIQDGDSGTGNISADPCFVDYNSRDLHLTWSSPCIDSGDPNGDYTGEKDIDGEDRAIDGRVEMGADELFQPDICYVDVNGDDSNGTSWAHAFNDINSAVTAARDGDEIWVAKGTYVLTDTINVDEAIRIYGGFDATETQRSQRDWENNVTTVDGNDSVRCFYVSADCTVDGLTITKGHAHVFGGTYIDSQGAGMYLHYCDPNIANCTFSDNESHDNGGGMHNRGSNPTITNCTFSNNECGDEGGGIRNTRGSNPVISDCTFTGNSAPDKGGGISNRINCHPTLTNCVFSGNSADSYGGGMQNESNCDPAMTDCIFTGNSASDGGGMYNRDYSDPTLVGCIFSGNAAGDDGGGMYNSDSDPTLINCVFHDNNSVDYGGAMCNKYGCSPTLINCVLCENDSLSDDGGAVYNYKVCCPIVINCTFYDNYADDDGGGMYNDESYPWIANCIFWDNEADDDGDEIENSSSTPYISYSDIEDCDGSGEYWDEDLGTDGGGNIDDSPDFDDDEDLDGPDDKWRTCDDGLHPEDPDCIDTGDNDAVPEDVTTDLKGSDRIINDTVDMGAYEYDSGC